MVIVTSGQKKTISKQFMLFNDNKNNSNNNDNNKNSIALTDLILQCNDHELKFNMATLDSMQICN